MIGYFIILVSSLVVQRQSNEIAVLRSRGASRMQMLGVYLLEGLLLGLVALGIGVLLAQAAALAMTWTRSFLTLAPTEVLPIDLTPEAWQRGLQMLGLLLLASLLPAFGAARYTVVSYKSERARDTKRPFWQRAYIDLLLLIPVYYGYSQLKERGTIAILGFGGGAADPFRTRCCCWRRRCIFSRWRWWWCACSRWRCACWPGCSAACRASRRSPRCAISRARRAPTLGRSCCWC